jgi:zinc transport system substrate-binding protein
MRFLAFATGAMMAGQAFADVPQVVADITPVHGLVSQVMAGVGAPALIVQQGASPHGYALRPSDAAALEGADIVVMMGADLTPGLAQSVTTLAPDAVVITLLEIPATMLLESREGAVFGLAAEDDHDHDHGGVDPHAWLDPNNAIAWLDVIAAALTDADPDNADTYRANALAGRADLGALSESLAVPLTPARNGQFVVFHDAYQYFEARFEIPVLGAIALSDASDPSPARIAALRDLARDRQISCALAEPQFSPGLIAAIFEGTDTRTAVIDPMGSDIPPGPGFYPALIPSMAETFASC